MNDAEPGIIGFYRMECARMTFQNGEPIEAVCREHRATPEELRRWTKLSNGEKDDD